MELNTIIPHIEALIFASDKPLTTLDIVELINNAFGFMEERISLDQVEACVEGIREKYNADFYSFEVRESGGGWQFLTKKEYHKTIAQLNGDKFLKRLSNAALETLAIIAYKQPITKGEVEAIRGVNSDYSIQKLLEKDLIIISGRNEDLPGKPLIYSTSKSFMDYFGINSADDLPKIKEVLAEQPVIQGTLIDDAVNNRAKAEEEITRAKETETPVEQDAASGKTATTMIVADNGELIEQPIAGSKDGASGIFATEGSDELNKSDKGAKNSDKFPEKNTSNDLSDDKKEEE